MAEPNYAVPSDLLARSDDFCSAGPVETRFAAAETGMRPNTQLRTYSVIGMKVAIVGSGYVGLVTGACFAQVGHQVICVDNDERKVEMLR